MVDSVFHSQSLGTAPESVRDQYADGKAARVWEAFIGDKNSRTQHYRQFLVGLLRSKGCRTVLDVACGTGIDSIMMLEEGFKVTSIDASDKMLKYALKARWSRRKEEAFDAWVIEEANWLTLLDDIAEIFGDGFDAVICLGNSFSHMPDTSGDRQNQRLALKNFERCLKPGGLFVIDHRNYDHILDSGFTPSKCIYYNSQHKTDIRTSILYVNGNPSNVTMDYVIDTVSSDDQNLTQTLEKNNEGSVSEFRLSYYPHKLAVFTEMLQEAFGSECKHTIYGDFKLLQETDSPHFYIHVMEKLI